MYLSADGVDPIYTGQSDPDPVNLQLPVCWQSGSDCGTGSGSPGSAGDGNSKERSFNRLNICYLTLKGIQGEKGYCSGIQKQKHWISYILILGKKCCKVATVL